MPENVKAIVSGKALPSTYFVQTWAPLCHDIIKGFGALEVLVGSHREGIAKQTWNVIEGIPDQIIVENDIVSKYPVKVVELKVGQVLLFSGRLIHKSGPQVKDGTRFTMVGSYHSVSNKNFYPDPTLSDNAITKRQYFEEQKLKW